VATIAMLRAPARRWRLRALGLDEAEGQRSISRGALATALGLPANLTFEVAPDTLAPPVERTLEAVEAYLARARAERPDLAAAEALADQARAVARGPGPALPEPVGGRSAGRTYSTHPTGPTDLFRHPVAHVPLFGFGHQ
jgi:hypothetical protein